MICVKIEPNFFHTIVCLVAFGFLMSGAGQAKAQNTALSEPYFAELEEIETCIASAKFRASPKSCTGVAQEVCLSYLDEKPSHIQQSHCKQDELRIWQGIYAEEVVKKLHWALRDDQGAELNGASYGGALATVMRAEIAWDDFRKAHCYMEMARWGPGTIVMTERPHCEMRLTAERIALLRGLVGME